MQNQIRILFVADDDGNNSVVADGLRREGLAFEETYVDSVKAMRSALEDEKWSIILVDCDLPDLCVKTALKALDKFDPPPPVIIISNSIDWTRAAMIMKAGARDVIKKKQTTHLALVIERELKDAEINRKNRRAERTLAESEDRFRGIAETTPVALFITRFSDSTVLYANPQAGGIIGIPHDRVVGCHLSDFFENRADRSVITAALERDGFLRDHELTIQRMDGTVKSFLLSLRAIRFEGEKAIISSYHDITERKRTERELEESRLALQGVLDAVPAMVNAKDRDSRYVFMNRYQAEKFGISTDYAVGKKASGVVGGQYALRAEIIDKEMLRTKQQKRNYEQEWIIQGGEPVTLLTNKVPILDEAGEVSKIVTVSLDITERKRAEMALRESEGRYQGIVENHTEFISRFTPEGKRTFINGAFCRFLGKPLDDLIGASLFDTVHRDYWLALKKYFAAFDHENCKSEMDTQVRRHDGEYRWVHWTNRAIFDDDNNIIEFHSAGRDVTKRRQAETELREREMLLQAILANVVNGIITTDDTGTILSFTRNAEETFGYKAGEVIGKNVTMLLPEEARPGHNQQVAHFFASNEGEKSGFLRKANGLRKDGTTFPLEIGFSEINLGGRRVFVASMLDRTDQREREKERRHLEVQLRHAQKVQTIGTLANGIAHDFNNILAPIVGYVDMALQDLPKDELLHNNLSQVKTAAERAKNLVRQILTVAGQAEQERHLVRLPEIVDEALKLLRPSLPATIEIRQDLDENCGPVLADPTQIHQIVMNLCTNAYQAMGERGGILTIRVGEVDGNEVMPGRDAPNGTSYVRLSVTDTGPGMTPSQVERIFEPFYTTKEVGEGTGLGLSVANGIISGHGGVITVDTTPGLGSTFHIYLQRVVADIAPEEKSAIEDSVLGKERILYIDDEPEIAEMGRQMLIRQGYTVTVSNAGLEALEVFKVNPDNFDVVITDQTMPGITGLDLARELLEARPGVPIVLVTGSAEMVKKTIDENVEIRGFLMKPILGHELSAAVRSALDSAPRKPTASAPGGDKNSPIKVA